MARGRGALRKLSDAQLRALVEHGTPEDKVTALVTLEKRQRANVRRLRWFVANGDDEQRRSATEELRAMRKPLTWRSRRVRDSDVRDGERQPANFPTRLAVDLQRELFGYSIFD